MMSKLIIEKTNVTLQFANSKDIGKTYKVEYYVQLMPKKNLKDPSVDLTMRNIDASSLKKAIFDNLQKKDEEYMDLVSFDTTKATFHLKLDKWLKNATKSLKGTKDIKNFSINFRLKEDPPPMIKKDILRTEWDKFLVRKFKQWVSEKKNRESRLLNIIFPKSVVSSINQRLYNMFDWSYDSRWNKVEAKLKSVWTVALMYSTIKLTSKDSLSSLRRKSKSNLFSIKVKKNLKRGSNKDFKLLTGRKTTFKK